LKFHDVACLHEFERERQVDDRFYLVKRRASHVQISAEFTTSSAAGTSAMLRTTL